MIDLASWAEAVPDAVVDRIRSARNVLAVGHENPDADTLGSTLAICRLVERSGSRATASSPIRFRRSITSARCRSRRTDPEPDADYDLLVVSDAGPSIGSVPSPVATPSCSSACRESSSITTPRTTSAAMPIGSTRSGRDLRYDDTARAATRCAAGRW